MQTNLFSDAFPQQEKALECMNSFDFHSALKYLEQAKELNPEIPNNAFYCDISEFCLKHHLHEDSDSSAIVDTWEMQHQEQAFEGHTTPERKFLFNLFARRLLELNEFDQHGTITDANSFFHVSACYTHTEKYEEARQSLANLLSGDKSSLPARYWGYYGDTALHVHKGREANLGYMRLFASNPFDVDWSTFSHSGLQRLFRALLHENEIQYAYGCWPYYAWAENLLEIPKGNRYVSNILHENISNLKIDDLRLTPLERMHRFSLYVFYEQSSYEYSPDADIRAAMKALDEKLFKEYLLLCEKRKKEGEH